MNTTKKVYQDDKVAVYVEHRNGDTIVYAHNITPKGEWKPGGYLTGHNMLILTPRKET